MLLALLTSTLLRRPGIDGSGARLGLFRLFERTLSDAEMAREADRAIENEL